MLERKVRIREREGVGERGRVRENGMENGRKGGKGRRGQKRMRKIAGKNEKAREKGGGGEGKKGE